MGEAPMDEKLVAACQMFLVPATILFAALAVATREALKTLLCIIGVVVSTAWLYRLYRWTGLSDADRNTAFALAYIFLCRCRHRGRCSFSAVAQGMEGRLFRFIAVERARGRANGNFGARAAGSEGEGEMTCR